MNRNGATPAIGIDLGTRYSCVGVWRNDNVEVIMDDLDHWITPSFVAFTPTKCLIGDAAMDQVTTNPTNTIYDIQRLVGRRYDDPEVQEGIKQWPFKVIKGADGLPKIVVSYRGEEKEYSAEEISSMLLVKLKNDAESYLRTTVTDAVITVPAYFNDSQRKATKLAAHLAGLDVLQILNEPVAAVIAYELDRNDKKKNVLVFDLDDDTLDVSLVTMNKGEFTVKARGGDTHFGGQDIINIMVDYFVKEFNRKHKMDISGNLIALRRLWLESERSIQILCSTTETTICIDSLVYGMDFTTKISRSKFEYMNRSFFSKCMVTVESLLRDSKIYKAQVDDIVLVGGSTRIPKVQQLLHQFFNGKELFMSIYVKDVIAYGAAIHARNLSKEKTKKAKSLLLLDTVPLSFLERPTKDYLHQLSQFSGKTTSSKGRVENLSGSGIDTVPLSLGVDAHDGVFSIIIPRNTPKPAKKENIYVTTRDNQTNISFNVYEGERSKAKDNNWLGKFEVAVSPAPKGKSKVKVVFSVDADGILNCWVKEVNTCLKKMIIIDNDKEKHLEEEIENMLKDAQKHKLEDVEYIKIMRARNILEEYIYNVKRKITTIGSTDKTKVHAKEIKQMENAIEVACGYVDGNQELSDVDEYQRIINQLQKVCVGVIAQLL